MAIRSACRSFRPTVTRLLTDTENWGLKLSGQIYHPLFTRKRHISTVNWWGEGAAPIYTSIVQQQSLCSTSRRTYGTSYREGLDEQEKSSRSSLDIGTDPASVIETPSAQPGSEVSVTRIPSVDVSIDSAFTSSSRHDLAMLFTCTVCDVRSAKTMSRETYEKGVVIVRCPGCQNLHLIADRYGWFGQAGSVEDFLAEKGVDVRKGSDSSYEFTVDDMSGWTPKGKSDL